MKIGLITIHNSCNYGAVLQTFATQEFLGKYGNVEIINYHNSYTDKTIQLLRLGTKPRDVLRLGKDILRFFPKLRILKKFRSFFVANYKLSGPRTKNLAGLGDRYDVLVCGSDQIWNPEIISENKALDPNYFLNFTKTGKKISYASSMGSHLYSKSELKEVQGHLENFSSISVRELDSAKSLSKYLGKNVEHVLDPTLLLDRKEWTSKLNCESANEQPGYILIYVLRKNKILDQAVSIVARALKLDVIVIDQDPFTSIKCNQHIKDAGPKEFIDLFLNASFVVTNSFHGTAFSVNFEKPFIVTPPPTGLNRIMSFLESVGASDRAISSTDEIKAIIDRGIDYSNITTKLNSQREKSKQYLINALQPQTIDLTKLISSPISATTEETSTN